MPESQVIVIRIESTSGNKHKVWFADGEVKDPCRATNSQRDDIIIQFGAFVGFRAFEIPQVRPTDVENTENPLTVLGNQVEIRNFATAMSGGESGGQIEAAGVR